MNLNEFYPLSQDELYAIDGGLPVVVGVLAAAGIVLGTAVVVACTVVVVAKVAQYVADRL